MQYRYLRVVCFGLAVAVLAAPVFITGSASAGGLSDDVYLTVAAIERSDFEFAGDINAEQEQGSGYMLGIGVRQSDWLSYELDYSRANNYANDQGSYSRIYHWEAVALVHPWQFNAFTPYLRIGAYNAKSRSNLVVNGSSQVSGNSTKNDVLFGAGLDYRLAEGKMLRVDFTRGGEAREDRLDRLSFGLVPHLGR